MSTRIQLSLYVAAPHAASIEALRRVLDPVQSRLIPAHVTLCREDEIAGLDVAQLASRFAQAAARPVTLRFGRPVAFSTHGILLPCIAGEDEFRALREHVLGTDAIREQAAHVTLAHPRNPKAPGNSLEEAASLSEGLELTFTSVRLIEQIEAQPWRVLREFALHLR